MAFRNLMLKPDRDPWERQPDESARMHGRFLAYRDLPPRKRRYETVAKSYGLALVTVQKQAVAHMWQDRVAAWDAHEAAERRAVMADRDRELCRVQLDMARASAAIAMRTLQHLASEEALIDPALLPRWAEMISKMRSSAMDEPDHVIGLVGAGGGPIQIDARLDGLSEEEKVERLNDVARGWMRVVEGGAA